MLESLFNASLLSTELILSIWNAGTHFFEILIVALSLPFLESLSYLCESLTLFEVVIGLSCLRLIVRSTHCILNILERPFRHWQHRQAEDFKKNRRTRLEPLPTRNIKITGKQPSMLEQFNELEALTDSLPIVNPSV